MHTPQNDMHCTSSCRTILYVWQTDCRHEQAYVHTFKLLKSTAQVKTCVAAAAKAGKGPGRQTTTQLSRRIQRWLKAQARARNALQ